MIRRFSQILFLLLALLIAGRSADAASRYDPALRFRTLATPHFIIYFHQGETQLARRCAAIAERVHHDLTTRLHTQPAGRTHVILVDQNDDSNGWATPLPYDTIEIAVAPPAPQSYLGVTDDWLRFVFAHEYTHILQLGQSRGYAWVVRHVFGRAPMAFPNLALPTWQIEGLATYEEGVATGRGRVQAGDFALLVDQAARQRRGLPLDRASSYLDDWPGGDAAYAYGGLFYAYLADRFGDDKLAELSARTAGRIYYLSSPAFKKVFGRSLGDLWTDFEQARAGHSAPGGKETGRRLTHWGFIVAGPRFIEPTPGRPEILYSSHGSDDFPSLMAVDLDGRDGRVTSRYGGDQVSVSGAAAVFDQVDFARSVALRSDLYLLDLASGGADRLTRNGRWIDPAISPDNRALACIRLRDGERHLALFDLPAGAWPRDVARLRAVLAATPRIELSEPGIEYASPRWSPDGRLLAVSRRLRDGPSQIVVVAPAEGTSTVLVSSSGTRNVTPTWTPDGATILFAADRNGGPFNLYAVNVGRAGTGSGVIYQVTNIASGASYPDVSPDGRQLAYVGYTSAGYDIFVMPLDRTTWQESPATPPTPDAASTPTPSAAPDASEAAPYRPWATLLPRYWMPDYEQSDQQLKLGADIDGSDVLGRHLYAASVLYRVAGKAGAPGSPRYDWAVGYTYDRWVPSFFADASDRTHFLRDVQLANGPIVATDVRTETREVGMLVPDFHVRYEQALIASLSLARETLNRGGLASAQSDRNAVRLAWFMNSARLYPYSISPEQGATIGVTGELVRQALGADAGANAVTMDGRAYLRLGGRHAVLALRGAFGVASGDERTERVFYLGGPGPNASVTDFGSDALNLLRGFGLNEFVGTRIACANLEYRVPLLRIERGPGTWPVFVRTVHATAFFDIGKAWVSDFSRVPFARSMGGEIAADIRLAYGIPMTGAVGVAWPHDPGGFTRPAVAYVRFGHAF